MRQTEAELIALQQSFSYALRQGPGAENCGVPEKRLAVYRELFFANIASGLSSACPVTKSLLGDVSWDKLVRDFWCEHRAKTPEYPRMPLEFKDWLSSRVHLYTWAPPWLLELVIWEVAELESILAPDDPVGSEVELEIGGLTVSASLRYFAFDWPVHRINRDWLPTEPEKSCLACFRTASDKVEFMELTPISLLLVNLIDSEPGFPLAYYSEQLANQLTRDPVELKPLAVQFCREVIASGLLINRPR